MRRLSDEEIKKIELNILDEFVEYCNKHQLKYGLSGGTLLGAIRHKGFIPWDDDIDITMPRKDYDRFVQLITSGEKIDNIDLVSYMDGSASYPYIKLIDLDTVVYELCANRKKAIGVWMDIFPMDGCPEDEKSFMDLYKKVQLPMKQMVYKVASLGSGATALKKILKFFALPVLKVMLRRKSIYQLGKQANEIAKTYDIDKSSCVANMMGPYGIKEKMPRSFLEMTEVEFEGKMYTATKEWDYYLSSVYGDYMKLPPESKRQAHMMVAYKK